MSLDQQPSEIQLIMRSLRRLAALKHLPRDRKFNLQEAMELLNRPDDRPPGAAPAQAAVPAQGGGSALPAPVRAAMDRGQKIEAIRLLREQSGLGLKEAKDAVEAYASAAPATGTGTGLAPGEVPASATGGWFWSAVALVIAALLLYRHWMGSGA